MAVLTACTTTGPINDAPREPVQDTVSEAPDLPEPESPIVRMPDGPPVTDTPTANRRDGLAMPHMGDREVSRVGLLLPLSASSQRLRAEAASMLKAAELAIFERDRADVVLLAFDTQGTESGASSAAQAAIRSGADVILGPVLARSVTAAGRVASRTRTPVIAFSTDQQVAGNGVYLLSFPPEAEIARIVEYAASTGVRNFAFLGPQSAYGRRVESEYGRSVRRVGGQVTQTQRYNGRDISAMQGPARELAQFYQRGERQSGGQGRAPFEAVILPEGGTELRSLAPLLPYNDLDPAEVQFLGTGLWYRDEVVREPALNGGVFAGPDREGKDAFEMDYDEQFGEEPSLLASLAYDAINIGAYVASGSENTRHRRATSADGFYGVDGLVRFNADGTPDRSLAIYQIRNGQFVVVEPAPTRFTGPS